MFVYRSATMLVALLSLGASAAFAQLPSPAPTSTPSPGSSSLLASPAPSPSVPLGSPPPGTTWIAVPAGTPVIVHPVGRVDSGSAHANDTFDIEASSDVVISDYIVVPKGAHGQCTIVQAQGSGGNGKGGALTYRFDFIVSADGGKIALAPAPQTKAEADRKGASSTATIIGVATFGLGGLFGHNLARGHQLTLDEKSTLTAAVANDIHVAANQRAAVDRYDR